MNYTPKPVAKKKKKKKNKKVAKLGNPKKQGY